jgi:hypothetical protein
MPADSRRTREQSWSKEDPWRRPPSRPRAKADFPRGFDPDDPAHRYAFEYASRYLGRHWDEIEPELRRRWDAYEHRGDSRWDEVKHTVREAYQRATENEATRD